MSSYNNGQRSLREVSHYFISQPADNPRLDRPSAAAPLPPLFVAFAHSREKSCYAEMIGIACGTAMPLRQIIILKNGSRASRQPELKDAPQFDLQDSYSLSGIKSAAARLVFSDVPWYQPGIRDFILSQSRCLALITDQEPQALKNAYRMIKGARGLFKGQIKLILSDNRRVEMLSSWLEFVRKSTGYVIDLVSRAELISSFTQVPAQPMPVPWMRDEPEGNQRALFWEGKLNLEEIALFSQWRLPKVS